MKSHPSKSSRKRNRRQIFNRNKRTRSRGARANTLGFDCLESRLLLATFVVNSIVDDDMGTVDGLISLREATIAANSNAPYGDAPAGDEDGDRILFDPSLAGSTLLLTEGEIEIADDLLIQAGNLGITVDAQSNSRIFDIKTTETVAIGKLFLVGGQAERGGAIYSIAGGRTRLNGVTMTANTATGAGGGAIYHAVGSLLATDSFFDTNKATGESGSGGALFLESGGAEFVNGSMIGNVANRAGGAIEIVNGSFQSTDLVVGAEGEGNVAGPGPSAAPGNGGGLHVTGSATVTISGGRYVDNFAAREGGGLWNQSGTVMFVSDVVISNNVASGDSADDGGGGIFNNGGTLIIDGANISGNIADGVLGSGGGIFSIGGDVAVESSTIENNFANRAGGGIEIVNGRFVMDDSSLGGATPDLGNIAGPGGTAAPGNGGGLHVTGDAAEVFIHNSSVENNVAASEGGGLWNQSGSTMRLDENSIVSSNRAHGDDADNGGGGIFNNGGNLTIVDSSISNNVADGTLGSGGGILSTAGAVRIDTSAVQGNVANRAGGGIEIIDGRLDVNDSVLGGESSDQGNIAGPDADAAAPGNGGGLHVTGMATEVFFRRSDVTNNVAASEGGGLWNQSGSLLRIDDTFIDSNTAQGDEADNGGGGIFNNGGRVTLNITDITNNNASGDSGSGGGLFSTDGRVLIFDTIIDGNAAARAGGGIEMINGLMRINDSSLSGNDAGITYDAKPGNGGGLHISGDMAEVFFRNTVVNDNQAASEGGGLWNQAGSFIRIDQGSEISSNEALGDDPDNGGGGVFNNGGQVTINNSTISGNLASGDAGSGGGIFSTDGSVLIFDSDIDQNSAVRAGGGIEVIDGLTRLTRVLVLNNDAGITLGANPGSGGGLHVTGNDSRVVMTDSIFDGNSAQNQGGGLWNQTESAIVFDGKNEIINNTAVTGVGGGVYSRGHLQILDSLFEKNASGDNGGGIFLTESGSSNVFDSEFNDNTSAASGGGIFNGNFLRVENSDFIDNVAAIDGGGIFTNAGATTIESGNNFSGNLPNDQN